MDTSTVAGSVRGSPRTSAKDRLSCAGGGRSHLHPLQAREYSPRTRRPNILGPPEEVTFPAAAYLSLCSNRSLPSETPHSCSVTASG